MCYAFDMYIHVYRLYIYSFYIAYNVGHADLEVNVLSKITLQIALYIIDYL